MWGGRAISEETKEADLGITEEIEGVRKQENLIFQLITGPPENLGGFGSAELRDGAKEQDLCFWILA